MADWIAVGKESREPVADGDKVTNHRGEVWTFVKVAREPEPGKSGRVLVVRPCGHDAQQHGPMGAVYWCTGWDRREPFPTVFDLEIIPAGDGGPTQLEAGR